MEDLTTLESLKDALKTESDLRAFYKQPKRTVVEKTLGRIDNHTRRFIELSPFLCMGTLGADGLGDVTPRGGEPGFVHVLNDKHLAMPDRPGNNRLDGLINLLGNPGVGLLFFIPGFDDTLRVNGVAAITRDTSLLNRFIVKNKPPISVIIIEVREIYMHCGKAVKRADLWNPDAQVERSVLPSTGKIYRDQLSLDADASAIDGILEEDARDNLY